MGRLSLRRYFAESTAIYLTLAPVGAFANPLGGQVVGGAATIAGEGTNRVTVDQTSEWAILNWNTFNVGLTQTTQFIQPNASAVTLNRVSGGLGVSQIDGTVSANGAVYVINPDGILFGRSANVNVGSFLATTHDIANGDFMAGKYRFSSSGKPSASIVNQGLITAAKGGFAALVAPGVRNDGVITATLGAVGLSAANGFTLDLYGDNLINLNPNDAIAARVIDVATGRPLKSLVQNTGAVRANGGKVVLTAAATRRVLDNVINSSGVVQANTVGMKKGLIVFGAATSATKPRGAPIQTVKISGALRTAGKGKGAGGTIAISGEAVALNKARIDASGATGGGQVLIGGDFGGGSPNALAYTQYGVARPTTRIADASSTSIDANSVIDASATRSGAGGDVAVWSNGLTTFGGSILANGAGSGKGGLVETSGRSISPGLGSVSAGQWLLDPFDLTVDSTAAGAISGSLNTGTNVSLVTSATQASGPGVMNASGSGDILVASPIAWGTSAALSLSAYRNIDVDANITASGGGSLAMATGTGGAGGDYYIQTGASVSFTGGASAGSTLTINNQPYTLIYDTNGLQSANVSASTLGGYYALAQPINAANLTNWTPIGTDGAGVVGNSGAGFSGVFAGLGNAISNLTVNLSNANYVGLFGYVSGTIRDVTLADANVTGANDVGALAGFSSATIRGASASGNVVGASYVGGLVGESDGALSTSSTTANVTPSAAGGVDIGGLVGRNRSAINQSFANGTVTSSTADLGQASNVGGLVGENAGTIQDSYSADAMDHWLQSSNVGGLVGYNSGSIVNGVASGFIAALGASGLGGFVGNNAGSIFDGYWNIDTSGLSTGSGIGAAGGITGLSTKGASPFIGSSYAGFDFSTPLWGIVSGASFPYLNWQFPTGAPQVVSGSGYRAPNIPPTANNGQPQLQSYPIGVVIGGAWVGYTSLGANGFYAALVPPGSIKPSGAGVLVSIDGYPSGNTFVDGATGSLSGINVYGMYLTLDSGASSFTGIASDLAATVGSLTSADFVFHIGPGPSYPFQFVRGPGGNPGSPNLYLITTGSQFNLDQALPFGAYSDYFFMEAIASGAVITQSAPINVEHLSLRGPQANFELTDTANKVAQFAADAGTVALGDKSALTIGKVNDITSVDANAFSLTDLTSGVIKQAMPIVAQQVSINAPSATVSLTDANNAIGTFAGSASTLLLTDGSALTLGADSVTASAQLKATTVGAGHSLTLAGPVTVGGLATLTSAGGIVESGAGVLSAGALTGSAVGGIVMAGANVISALQGFTNTGSGNIALTDAEVLNITGTVNETPPQGLVAITTTAGGLTVGNSGVVTADVVTFDVAGEATESSKGQIDCTQINVTAVTGISLVGNNKIQTIGMNQTKSGPDKVNR
jgi:filamentous hemagglutinin family protein